MTAEACGTSLDPRVLTAVLPADGATLATTLSRGLVLVAHTGNAHLGIPVDRPLLRGLARAQGAADRAYYGDWLRERDVGAAGAAGTAGPGSAWVAVLDEAQVIGLRRATSHTFEVSGPDIHLTLHATRDPRVPDVHVELRMSSSLLTRLAQYQHLLHRRDRTSALVAFLVVLAAFVALTVIVA